jgi:hypothetical protein
MLGDDARGAGAARGRTLQADERDAGGGEGGPGDERDDQRGEGQPVQRSRGGNGAVGAAGGAGEAITLSQQIVTLTNAQVPLFLLTLSAALAEGGRFDEATAVAVRSAEVYQMSGDHKMGVMVQEQIVPALRNHQPIRDNPAALTP